MKTKFATTYALRFRAPVVYPVARDSNSKTPDYSPGGPEISRREPHVNYRERDQLPLAA